VILAEIAGNSIGSSGAILAGVSVPEKSFHANAVGVVDGEDAEIDVGHE
jgi:hypothetical protein